MIRRWQRPPSNYSGLELTDSKWGDGMTLKTAAAITALLSISAAQAQDGPYQSEQAARTCIQQRLAELLAERNPNIAADAPLTTCTNDLKAEFKAKGKSYCEAIGYIAWLVSDENSKRNGITGSLTGPTNRFFCIVQNRKPGTGIDEHEAPARRGRYVAAPRRALALPRQLEFAGHQRNDRRRTRPAGERRRPFWARARDTTTSR